MRKKKVQVVITNSFNEVLLLKMTKRRGFFWQNVTGSVEENETFLEAATREASEETGIKLKNIKSLAAVPKEFYFTDQYQNEVHEKCFHIIAANNWDVLLDPKEHEDYQWKKIGNVNRNDVHYESNYQAIKEVDHRL